MSEWKKTTLGGFISLQRGHDLPYHERRAGKIPVIGSGGVTGLHDSAAVSGPGITIGRAANLGVPTLIEEDFWPLNTTLYVTDFHGNDIRFAYYLLRTLDFTGFNSGSVQPMLNRNYIKDIPIVIPDRKEQEAVSAILGALDDKIGVNDRIASTYEDLLRTLFAELRIDVESDPSSAVATSDFVDFNPTLKVPRDSEAVYLDMAAVPTDRAMVSEWTRREPKSGTRFANGDTVMARITPCLENGKTAFIDFMEDDEVGIGSTEFIVMRARPGISIYFPYFLARSPRFRANAVQNMVGSSGRQRVSAAQIIDFPITRPDSEMLSIFDKTADMAFAHLRSLTDESGNLAELRDKLLPKLMSGEIRVRDVEKVIEDVT